MNLVNGILNLYCAGLGFLFILFGYILKKTEGPSEPGKINRALLMIATFMLLTNGAARCFFYRNTRFLCFTGCFARFPLRRFMC